MPLAAAGDALVLEPGWLKTRTTRLAKKERKCRLVHFTDIHHKGDTAYLRKVVARINAAKPDVVCFTGDIVEHMVELAEIVGPLLAFGRAAMAAKS